MTWDIKRVFPYYKRTQVLKDLKTPTPRKTDTSPETTHHRYRKEKMPQALALVGIFDAAVCKAAERFYKYRKVLGVGFGCWVCAPSACVCGHF